MNQNHINGHEVEVTIVFETCGRRLDPQYL